MYVQVYTVTLEVHTWFHRLVRRIRDFSIEVKVTFSPELGLATRRVSALEVAHQLTVARTQPAQRLCRIHRVFITGHGVYYTVLRCVCD